MNTTPTMKRILLLLFFSVINFNLSSAAPFSANTFTLYKTDGATTNFIRELKYDGTFTQDITLPQKHIDSNGHVLRLDTTGTLLLLPMYTPGTPIVSEIRTVDSTGQIPHQTYMQTGSNIIQAAATSSLDVWMCYGTSVAYLKRGDTSARATDMVTGEGSASMQSIQLVGSRMYVLTNSLKFMDPVIKTGTTTLTSVDGVDPPSFFYFLKPDVLYIKVAGADTLVKYTVNGTSGTEAYRLAITVAAGGVWRYFHVMEVDTATYIFILVVKGATSFVYRYTDDGTTFNAVTTIYVSDSSIVSIGPSPKVSCFDGIQNQDETDLDCGGTVCKKCGDAYICKVDSDCTNGYCTSGKLCQTPTCNDQVKNGKETDVDCGGAGTCLRCPIDKGCSVNGDCQGYLCDGGVCVASCFDSTLNQNETDVDCGGICSPCTVSLRCFIDSDCTTGFCNPVIKKCSPPACNDNFKNQDETDVDCGGATCSGKCANNKACVKDSDCKSNICTGNICANPPVPVSEPVAAPTDGPASDQSPQSSAPSTSNQPSSSNQPTSSPNKQTGVSAGSVIEMSFIGLITAVILF